MKYPLTPAILLVGALLLGGCDFLDARKAHKHAEAQLAASQPDLALPHARLAHDLAPSNARYHHTYQETQRQLLRALRHTLEESPTPLARLHVLHATLDTLDDLLDTDTSDRVHTLLAQARADSLRTLESALDDFDAARALRLADHPALASAFAGPDRPRVEEILSHLDAVELASAALDKNDPATAARHLARAPRSLGAARPVHDRLDALAAELDAAETEALALAATGRHREAHQTLAPLAARHAWRPSLATTAAKILADGAAHHVAELQAALPAGDLPRLEAALADLAYCRETEFPFTAAELSRPESFAVFIEQLQLAGLAPAAGQPRDSWFDLVLCAGLLERFPDRDAARAHLAAGSLEWADHLAATGYPHLAAHARSRALAYGAPADSAPLIEREPPPARLALHIAPATHPADQPATDFLQTVTPSVLAALDRRLSALASPAPTASGATAIHARIELSRIDLARREETTPHEARYLSGQRSIANPDYAIAQNAAAEALAALNRAQAGAQSVARQASINRSLSSLGGSNLFGQLSNTLGDVATTSAASSVTPYENAYREAQQKLASTPPTIAEDVYATHTYAEITHHLTATADAAIVFFSGPGRAHRLPVKAEYTHRTTEFRGDPAKGGKIQAPDFPASAEIENALAAAWIEQLATREKTLLDLATQTAVEAWRATPHPTPEDRLETLLAELVLPLRDVHPALATELSRAPELGAYFGPRP